MPLRVTVTKTFLSPKDDADAAIEDSKSGAIISSQTVIQSQPITQAANLAQPSHIKTVAPAPGQPQAPAITPAAPAAAPASQSASPATPS